MFSFRNWINIFVGRCELTSHIRLIILRFSFLGKGRNGGKDDFFYKKRAAEEFFCRPTDKEKLREIQVPAHHIARLILAADHGPSFAPKEHFHFGSFGEGAQYLGILAWGLAHF